MYAYLAFQGYYFAVKKRWVLSALSLAGATGTRATGIFNIGVLGWQILFGTSLPSFGHLYPAVSPESPLGPMNSTSPNEL